MECKTFDFLFSFKYSYFERWTNYNDLDYKPKRHDLEDNRDDMIEILKKHKFNELAETVKIVWNKLINEISADNLLQDLLDEKLGNSLEKKALFEMIFLSPSCPDTIKKMATVALSLSESEFSKIISGRRTWFNSLKQYESIDLYQLSSILYHIKSLTPEHLTKDNGLQRTYEISRDDLRIFKQIVKDAIDWWHIKFKKINLDFTGKEISRSSKLEISQYEAIFAFRLALHAHDDQFKTGVSILKGGLKELRELFPSIQVTASLGQYVSKPTTMSTKSAQSLIDLLQGFINEVNSFHLTSEVEKKLLTYHKDAKQKLEKYRDLKAGVEFLHSKGEFKVKFQYDNEGLEKFLKSSGSGIDNFISDYTKFLKKTDRRKWGKFPRHVYETMTEINRIIKENNKKPDNEKIPEEDLPKYYKSSYFSTKPTSYFGEEDYRPAYILLRNKKTDLVYDGHDDESEFEEICKYADPKGEAIRNVKDEFRVTGYDQVHHNEFIEAIFDDGHKTGVFAVEIPVWYYDDASGWLITGHIDTIKIVGKIVYIVDYKPDYTINLKNPQKVGSPFFDAVPQLAVYAILFEKMFHKVLHDNEYEVRCAILNQFAVKLFNPKNCLALYTAMYELVKPNKIIPWKPLISDDLVEYYKDAYRNAR